LARYAIIDGDQVTNVIVADSQFVKQSKIKATECDENVSPGWSYIDGEFVAPKLVTFDDSETV